MTISGGRGANTFTVVNDGNLWGGTVIDSGDGGTSISNHVTVNGTSGPLTVDLVGGTGTVDVSPSAENLDALAGALTVHGGGATQLVIDDQNANLTDGIPILTQDTLTGTTLTRISQSLIPPGFVSNHTATITYDGLAGLTLNTGVTPNLVHVVGTSTATTVNAGPGNTLVDVSPSAENLDALAGALTVHGGGATQLVIDDQNANLTDGIPILTQDTLTGTTLTRISQSLIPPGFVSNHTATITYDGLASLTLNTGVTPNLVHVVGTSTATTVNAGPGNTLVDVSPSAENLDALAGALTVHGGGATHLVIDDQNNLANKTYTITDGTFQCTGSASITYGGLSSLSVNGGHGADRYIIGGTSTGVATTINGGAGINTLVGPDVASTWNITGANAGTVGTVTFAAVENLTGGTGVDAFVFSAGAKVTGKIDGGGGNDWLDYAAYTTPVSVNLTSNTATGVAGGIANIRNVRGGQGGDTLTGNSLGNILIGGAGLNKITGGTGPSILIGGKGTDTVTGNSLRGDILIAGYTDYDSSSIAHDQALELILAEWQSANSYRTRISHIKYGGGLNGSNKLIWGVTVHDNSIANANTLTGSGSWNWFFANLGHTHTNITSASKMITY